LEKSKSKKFKLKEKKERKGKLLRSQKWEVLFTQSNKHRNIQEDLVAISLSI